MNNKEILYKIHDYDPKSKTKSVHHIIPRSEGGTNDFENLSLLDRQMHAFIHHLIQLLDNQANKWLTQTGGKQLGTK